MANQKGIKPSIRTLLREQFGFTDLDIKEERTGNLHWFSVHIQPVVCVPGQHHRVAEFAVNALLAERQVAGGCDVWVN